MGDPDIAGADTVPALAGATRDILNKLLGRAVQIGLLVGYGGGYYGIHPALPWYFTTLYHHHHPTPQLRARAERAYTHALATLGDYYFGQAEAGRADQTLPALRIEEANLQHALQLARTHHLPADALGCLQGLNQLLDLTGRNTEWARLIEEIEGD
jgi:hypothetical protein